MPVQFVGYVFILFLVFRGERLVESAGMIWEGGCEAGGGGFGVEGGVERLSIGAEGGRERGD